MGDEERDDDRPGVVLDGRYELRERLSLDELTSAWLAHDRVLDRRAVVRLLHRPLLGAPQAADRFRREAIAAAAIDHAHVACQYAVELREELAFTVSEYVDGPSLAQLLERHGTLGPEAAGAIAYQVAAGLAAIHAQGIVHRAIGPSSLRLGAHGRVRIVDYRRASLPQVGLRGARELDLFEDATVHAPEVIQDDQATMASDVFALGRTVHLAWRGAGRTGSGPPTGHWGQLRWLLGQSAQEARRRELERLVLEAAHPDPARRPSAAAIVERLEPTCGMHSARVLEPLAVSWGGRPGTEEREGQPRRSRST